MFVPTDPLGIDELLSPEDLAMRDSVRGWAADRVLPHIAEWYETGELPVIRELARELGGIGALGMSLDGYGCAGASAVQYGLACLELEAADSGIRSLVSVQGSLAMYAIHRFGSEEQKQRWLPGMASGEVIGCFGLTEPDHGSDPASMRTSVQALVVVTEDADVIERAGTGAFADRTLAGSAAQIVDAMGRYAELGFDEFIVPDANLGRDRAQRRERLERIDAEIVRQL